MPRFIVKAKSLGMVVGGRLRVYPERAVVEFEADEVSALLESGALAPEGDVASSALPEPKQEAKPESEPEPETKAAAVADEVSRPARAASIDDWRKYAESLGIVTKGLSKKDIIAATQ